MPRYSDEWLVDKALFEHQMGGDCVCCIIPNFDPDGLRGLINAVSDIETDAANAEYAAHQVSPWPPDMRDQIWGDRVRVRMRMKKEMPSYKSFIEEECGGIVEFRKWCLGLDAKSLKQIFQMPKSEITDTLKNSYNVQTHSALGVVMSSVVEQLANFPKTRYPIDARGETETNFENQLKYNRMGGFILNITKQNTVFDQDVGENKTVEEIDKDVLDVFLSSMAALGGPKLLQRGKLESADDDDDDADDIPVAKGKKQKGPSFRSDRRLGRLVIQRNWADQFIAKYRSTLNATG